VVVVVVLLLAFTHSCIITYPAYPRAS
jgi:hypothetical protein